MVPGYAVQSHCTDHNVLLWEAPGSFWTRVSGKKSGNLIIWGTKVLRPDYSLYSYFSLTSLSQFSFPAARQTCWFRAQVHFWTLLLHPNTWYCYSDSGVNRASVLLPCPNWGEGSEVCLVVCKGPRCDWFICGARMQHQLLHARRLLFRWPMPPALHRWLL